MHAPGADKLTRIAFAAGAIVVVVYFILFAGGGIRIGFSHDDLMIMHRAFVNGTLGRHLANSFLFFLPAVRPMGNALYRLTYDFAGLNPLPLHAICFTLALLNVFVLFLVTARISGSFEIGLLAALIGAFHDNMMLVYYDAGTCYDLLAFPFFYLALLLYVSIRQRGRMPGTREIALVFICFVLALAAKEIALSLPLILIAYELVWDPPRSVRAAVSWMLRQGRTSLLCGAAAILFVGVRVYGAEGLANMTAFKPDYSLVAYLNVLSVVMNDLFYRVDTFTPMSTAIFWIVLIAIAALMRSRFLIFCLSLALIGLLPLGFVTPRGLYSVYVPFVGLWAYAAGLLVMARRYFTAEYLKTAPRNGDTLGLLAQGALFIAVLLPLVSVNRDNFKPNWTWLSSEADQIEDVLHSLEGLHLNLPPGARVLVLNDAFDPSRFAYDTLYLISLLHHDPNLEVEHCAQPATDAAASYAAVLTYRDGRFQRVQGCAGRSCCR
ncbi:MAG TPA: hypothetical protein VEU96_00185 [Bryobacteraceae bacterium]|nr:hypothetical protein [Bryobacteraceae bacterium]